MKRTNNLSSRIRNSLSVILLFIAGCNIFSPNCSDFEQNLKNICQANDSTYTMVASQITDIDFDKLYIFEEQWFPDEVEKIIGIRYNKVLPDDGRQFIFIKDRKIIKQFHSECPIDFTMNKYKGYLKINRTSKLHIKRREFQNNPQSPKDGSYFSYTVSVAEQ